MNAALALALTLAAVSLSQEKDALRTGECRVVDEPLATLEVGSFGLDPAAGLPKYLYGADVDRGGRLFVAGWKDVFVFGPDGCFLFTLERDPGHAYGSVRSMTFGADGTMLRNRTLHGREFDLLEPDGCLRGRVELESSRVVVLPGGGGRWAVLDEEVQRLDASGALFARHQRRPDGGVIDQIYAHDVAPNGSLAVVEGFVRSPAYCGLSGGGSWRPPREPRADPRPTICTFPPDGRPSATWRLPDESLPGGILFLGGDLILCDSWPRGGALRRLDPRDGTLTSIELPPHLRDQKGRWTAPPERDELWWLGTRTRCIHRLVLR